MLWLNASRDRIKSEHPGISVTEISKKAGEMWKQIGKDKKEVMYTLYHIHWTFQNVNASDCFLHLTVLVHFKLELILVSCSFHQEWEGKAEEAKKEYERAMREYKESGGGSSVSSKKYSKYSNSLRLTSSVKNEKFCNYSPSCCSKL